MDPFVLVSVAHDEDDEEDDDDEEKEDDEVTPGGEFTPPLPLLRLPL